MALISLIPELPPDTMFSFIGRDRQRDGTWNVARFDVLATVNGENYDVHFEVGPDAHYLLPNVANALAKSGWATLGAKYLSMMADNGIRVRESSPVSNPRGPVFADGVKVDEQMNARETRALERSLRKWRDSTPKRRRSR